MSVSGSYGTQDYICEKRNLSGLIQITDKAFFLPFAKISLNKPVESLMRVNGKNLLRKEKKHLKCALFSSGVIKSCYLSPSRGWYLPSLCPLQLS